MFEIESLKLNLPNLWNKARAKVEMKRVLAWEGNLYLPSQKKTSIYFVRDVKMKK